MGDNSNPSSNPNNDPISAITAPLLGSSGPAVSVETAALHGWATAAEGMHDSLTQASSQAQTAADPKLAAIFGTIGKDFLTAWSAAVAGHNQTLDALAGDIANAATAATKSAQAYTNTDQAAADGIAGGLWEPNSDKAPPGPVQAGLQPSSLDPPTPAAPPSGPVQPGLQPTQAGVSPEGLQLDIPAAAAGFAQGLQQQQVHSSGALGGGPLGDAFGDGLSNFGGLGSNFGGGLTPSTPPPPAFGSLPTLPGFEPEPRAHHSGYSHAPLRHQHWGGYPNSEIRPEVPWQAGQAAAMGCRVELPGGREVLAPNPRAAEAVRAALTQEGNRYVWGGSTPQQGLDCSGLTHWAYGQAGIHIPRVACDQAVGVRVGPHELAPGDLAVWSGHVAMVVGDGMMIESPEPGENVHLTPIRTHNEGDPFYGFFRPSAGSGGLEAV